MHKFLFHLILRLCSFIDIFNEPVSLYRILRWVLPSVHVRMLDIQWVFLWVDLAVGIVQGHLIENDWISATIQH